MKKGLTKLVTQLNHTVMTQAEAVFRGAGTVDGAFIEEIPGDIGYRGGWK